jgi:hypothetical protein
MEIPRKMAGSLHDKGTADVGSISTFPNFGTIAIKV